MQLRSRLHLAAPLPSYPARSWIDPRVEVRRSPISGSGLFAREPLRAGEVIVIWGGSLFSAEEVRAGIARERSLAMIGPGLYLGSHADEPVLADEFMNHACDPNLWLVDDISIAARRPIAAGEELTIDYAMWDADPAWAMECRCGSPLCRGRNTGDDWRIPELQRRYHGHFSSYVAGLIAQTRRSRR